MATADALAREAAKKKLATTKAFGLTATTRAPAKPKADPYTGTDLAIDLVPGGRFVANTVETLKGNRVSPADMQAGYIGMLPIAGGVRAASTALGAAMALTSVGGVLWSLLSNTMTSSDSIRGSTCWICSSSRIPATFSISVVRPANV